MYPKRTGAFPGEPSSSPCSSPDPSAARVGQSPTAVAAPPLRCLCSQNPETPHHLRNGLSLPLSSEQASRQRTTTAPLPLRPPGGSPFPTPGNRETFTPVHNGAGPTIMPHAPPPGRRDKERGPHALQPERRSAGRRTGGRNGSAAFLKNKPKAVRHTRSIVTALKGSSSDSQPHPASLTNEGSS